MCWKLINRSVTAAPIWITLYVFVCWCMYCSDSKRVKRRSKTCVTDQRNFHDNDDDWFYHNQSEIISSRVLDWSGGQMKEILSTVRIHQWVCEAINEHEEVVNEASVKCIHTCQSAKCIKVKKRSEKQTSSIIGLLIDWIKDTQSKQTNLRITIQLLFNKV